MNPIDFTYLQQPPKRWTFEQPKLKLWVESWCLGRVLNLFAGKTVLNVPEIRVDIDPDTSPSWCGDAFDYVHALEHPLFDTIILDPPYNIRKAREKYGSRWIGKLTKIKNELPRILAPRGRVISLGYDTVGMSRSRGFKKIAVCVVCHGGDHNDTLCLVEEKVKKKKRTSKKMVSLEG